MTSHVDESTEHYSVTNCHKSELEALIIESLDFVFQIALSGIEDEEFTSLVSDVCSHLSKHFIYAMLGPFVMMHAANRPFEIIQFLTTTIIDELPTISFDDLKAMLVFWDSC